ncbi:CHAT domain-containing protein [Streptomyces bambusae]|uniref:CHAT domain-containing protein n=1 Tax=Streptomyces bambusae TaxID=1550616 RepID=UPI001CFDF71D|nr:CHAT domain-containing protein [Streptomyces bambusae]MCB5167667.1 CHAT domain-containing protein [Streptomyces bambusae]
MLYEESGGQRGIHAWVDDATARAAALGPTQEQPLREAVEYDTCIDELTQLAALLQHDPAARAGVAIRLGVLLVLRYAAGNCPEDKDRADRLLRDFRAAEPPAEVPPDDLHMARLFHAYLSVPQLGRVLRGDMTFTELSLLSAEAGSAEAMETVMREFVDARPADRSPETMRVRTMVAAVDAFRATGDADGLLAVIPEDHPFASQLRTMARQLQGVPADVRAEWVRQAPTPDVQSPDALAMQGLVPALTLMTAGMTADDPDQVRAAGAALRTAHRQMPPGHPLTEAVGEAADALRYLGEGSGGVREDMAAARQSLPEALRKLTGALATRAGAEHALPMRLLELRTALDDARRADDVPGVEAVTAELHGIADGLTADAPAYCLVQLALADAYLAAGRLLDDTALQLRGVDHLDLAVAAGPQAPSAVQENLRVREEQARALRAGLTRDPAPLAEMPAVPADAPPGDLRRAAQAVHIRYLLTRDPADLDEAIGLGERARAAFGAGRAQSIAADTLWELSGYLRSRWDLSHEVRDLTGATGTALAALRALGADVVLQLGAEQGLYTARSGAQRAVEAAWWAATRGQAEEAVTALELGRALVLRAASVSADVPGLLESGERPGLAAAWREHLRRSADGDPGTFADELPSALRRQVLEALDYRGEALAAPPGCGELAAAVEACDADALVYLLAGPGSEPGVAVLVGPACGTRAVLLPGLCADRSGPLLRYLATAADRSRVLAGEALTDGAPAAADGRAPAGPAGPLGEAATPDAAEPPPLPDEQAVEQAWESALSDLCDWAYPAALGPVLGALSARTEGPPGSAGSDGPPGRQRLPRLVLVPCGNLGVVPWHAARLPGGGPGDYACRIAAVSYAASGGQFLRTAGRDRRAPAEAPVLLADPRLELTHAEREAAALNAAFYPGARMLGAYYEPVVEPEAEGTPDELLAVLRDRPSLVHLACHGSAGPSPDVSSLHLAFPVGAEELSAADGGPGARPDLGMLTVARLLDHASGGRPDPSGPLVVLSACETDLSRRDHDEALTLATAFVTHGARDVVGSRWTTQDGASALMMAVFHHHVAVEGRSPADALRETQLWMLDPDRRDPGTLGPELARELHRPGLDRLPVWAAYVHQGNPGARPAGHVPEPPHTRRRPARDPALTLLRLVGVHLDGVRTALSPGEYAVLRTRLETLAARDPAAPRPVRLALQGVRLALLPLPLGHPVRRALDGTRLSGVRPGPAVVSGAAAVLELMADEAAPPAV